jgi:hypothetical protein
MTFKTSTPLLEFNGGGEKLRGALSAAVLLGNELWVASDELTSVERLTLRDGAVFGAHRSFELHDFINLPAHGQKKPNGKDVDQEIDIEGLDVRDGYLWLVGSHSIKRKRFDTDDRQKPDDKNSEKLSKTDAEGNRFILARVPVVTNEATGEVELSKAAPDGTRTAAQLPGTMTQNTITRAIAATAGAPDPHLATFLTLPGKDNGLDIEGLAVSGTRIFLGLRGPVLRGWAVVLELELAAGGASELTLQANGAQGRPYKKHFLDLGGLGVRDLCLDGSDLLLLAGPTMNLDGPVQVFRWRDGALTDRERVVFREELGDPVLTVPHGQGADHAEAITLVPAAGLPAVLIIYDSPSAGRLVGASAVRADVLLLT